MSGDIAGAVSTSINMIGDLGQAIMDLSPAYRQWKTDMLETAKIQRDALSGSGGMFESPWRKALEQDASAREAKANAGFWQRLSWSLFGGAPRVMKTEAAKLQAELETIFNDLGSGLSSAFTSSMESAFLEGDMANWAENFDKSFDETVGKLILKTMVEAAVSQGAVANDLAALTEAIQQQDYDAVPGILTSIRSHARLAMEPIAAVAPSLPGYGSSNRDEDGLPRNADLFGNAPNMQLGAPRFELTLPPALSQLVNDLGAAGPVLYEGARELREGARELRAALRERSGQPPAHSGRRELTL